MPPPPPLTLEHYAGVKLATDEGIRLELVLAQESIDAAEWTEAAADFEKTIANSDAQRLRYEDARRRALDCLVRPIDPLDTDPSAWLGLVGAVALSDEPDAVLAKLSLTYRDVDRLGRSWNERAKKDPELARKMNELAATATLPSSVKIGETKLAPFPWTRPRAVEAPPPPPPPPPAAAPEVVVQPTRASFQLRPLPAVPPIAVPVPPMADPNATAMVPALASADLPFSKGQPGAKPPPPPISIPERKSDAGETLGADPAPNDRTLPFDENATLAFMKLERYADLAAALRIAPQDADATMRRFGLVESEQRGKIHNLWKLRFEANAELRRKFEALVERKVADLRK